MRQKGSSIPRLDQQTRKVQLLRMQAETGLPDCKSEGARRWKPSPMDLETICRWKYCSRAKDGMMSQTDSTVPKVPWNVVEPTYRRRARIT